MSCFAQHPGNAAIWRGDNTMTIEACCRSCRSRRRESRHATSISWKRLFRPDKWEPHVLLSPFRVVFEDQIYEKLQRVHRVTDFLLFWAGAPGLEVGWKTGQTEWWRRCGGPTGQGGALFLQSPPSGCHHFSWYADLLVHKDIWCHFYSFFMWL